jgi:Bacterial capsule synthesis protein PGA_cap
MRFAVLLLLLHVLGACAAAPPPPPFAVAARPAVAADPTPDAPTPSPPTATPTPPPDSSSFTFSAVGDVMLGSTYPDASGKNLPPDDGQHLLDEVAPVLSAADIAFGNLEGPMVDGGVSSKCGAPAPPGKATSRRKKAAAKTSCYAFRVPTRYGAYLKSAGFDVMGLANNHALDFGEDGRQSSLAVLDGLGIAHSGPVGDIAHIEVRGIRVALIAFSTYAHSYDLNDLGAAQAVVAGEASTADVVIVSFHGGAEGATRLHVPAGPEMFYNENRGDLRVFTHAMIDAGAALVFGHGPHVVRGLEVYKDRLIAYSLGNFATYGAMNLLGPTGIAGILQVTLGKDRTLRAARIVPTLQSMPGGPHLDPRGQVIPLLRQLSTEDFAATAPAIADDGTLTFSSRSGS